MAYSDSIKERYNQLCSPPEDAGQKWFQWRGYELEKLLKSILTEDNLEPRISYKPKGEQVDGSLYLDGRFFLLEAKWHKNKTPASSIYQFKGKVDGKLVGTIGIFLSMGGYSKDAVDALTLGKSLNVILFDKYDIDNIISSGACFRDVLKFKLRMAADEGAVYYPSEVSHFSARTTPTSVPLDLSVNLVANGRSMKNPYSSGIDIFIVCEGETDSEVISYAAKRILSQHNLDKVINVIVANGKMTIPKIANTLFMVNEEKPNILLVADSDGSVDETMMFLQNSIDENGWRAVIPDPSIEAWLGIDVKSEPRLSYAARKRLISENIQELDINVLKDKDSSFSEFYNFITGLS